MKKKILAAILSAAMLTTAITGVIPGETEKYGFNTITAEASGGHWTGLPGNTSVKYKWDVWKEYGYDRNIGSSVSYFPWDIRWVNSGGVQVYSAPSRGSFHQATLSENSMVFYQPQRLYKFGNDWQRSATDRHRSNNMVTIVYYSSTNWRWEIGFVQDSQLRR